MDSDYYEKANRLLDIVYDLANENQSDDRPPFYLDEDGGVRLNEVLKEKLAMNDDRELEEWAQDNIKDLF
jgi:Cft2 family RNA processing exonuclease